MPSLIPEQLKAQIDRWRGRRGWESERVFAIRTDFPYVGAPEIICGGLAVKVADCRSDLEARDLMLDLTTQDGHGLLLLMRTDEDRIGEDVRARFAGKTVHTLDPREVLKEIYQATAIDPRISNDDALLEALVMAGSGGTGRKAPGGMGVGVPSASIHVADKYPAPASRRRNPINRAPSSKISENQSQPV
jgi:hypothetical protein